MPSGTAFPAFIRATYDSSSNGFVEFERQALASSARVRLQFENDFDNVKAVVADALTQPRNAAGSLDLGVGRYREAAAAAQVQAIALREVATAAMLLARETGDATLETRRYTAAASAAAVEAERNAAQAQAAVVTQERLQEALNRSVSQTQAVIGASRGAANAGGRALFRDVRVGSKAEAARLDHFEVFPLAVQPREPPDMRGLQFSDQPIFLGTIHRLLLSLAGGPWTSGEPPAAAPHHRGRKVGDAGILATGAPSARQRD